MVGWVDGWMDGWIGGCSGLSLSEVDGVAAGDVFPAREKHHSLAALPPPRSGHVMRSSSSSDLPLVCPSAEPTSKPSLFYSSFLTSLDEGKKGNI